MMAEDWIKFSKKTLDKPEIIIAAARLGISHGDAMLAFLRLYCWVDNESTDGFVPDVSPEIGDRITQQKGFINALAAQKEPWVTILPDGIRFNDFDIHNGRSAKKRAQEAKKKRRQRDNNPASEGKNVPNEEGNESRSRPALQVVPSIIDIDIKNKYINTIRKEIPESFNTEEFLKAFEAFVISRESGMASCGKVINKGQVSAWLMQCVQFKTVERAVAALLNSASGGRWNVEEALNAPVPDGSEMPANARPVTAGRRQWPTEAEKVVEMVGVFDE